MAQVTERTMSSAPLAQHPGRLPELRAARAARRHDPPARRTRASRARIKNFDRFALIVEHDGADQLIFKHAIATIAIAQRAVGNYFARTTVLSARAAVAFRPRHRHRPRQRRASASCPTPPPTATKAATRSATSPAQVPLQLPTLRALGLIASCARRSAGAAGRRRWRLRPHGRSVAGQGLGDRPLGADGPRPRPAVPDLSRRVSRRTSSPRSSARIGRGTSATSSRRARTSSSELGAEHMRDRHARSSTRRPTACSRSRRTRT